MRRYVAILLISCVGAVAASAALNFAIDPTGHWQTGLIRPDPAAGKAPTILRLRDSPAPTLLILGDSRAQGFEPAHFEKRVGGTAFNGAMPGASTTTELRIFERAADRGRLRSLIYVLSFEDLRHNAAELSAREAVTQLVSWSTVRLSVRNLEQALGLRHEARGPYRWAADGHAILNADLWPHPRPYASEPPPSQIESTVEQTRYYTGEPDQPEKRAAFVEIMQRANRLGITPVVVIPPYHPQLATRLEDELARSDQTLRAFLDTVQAEAHFTVVDARRLDAFGGRSDNFVDGVHMGPSNFARLADLVLERAGGDLR